MPFAVSRLPPPSFGFVMATGIVAVAAHQQGWPHLASLAFDLALLAWVLLGLQACWRLAQHPRECGRWRRRRYSDGGSSRFTIVISFDSIEMKPRSERSFRIRFTISREAPTMLARSCCESFSPTMSLPSL